MENSFLENLINLIKGCCKNTKEAKEKRNKVLKIGLVLLGIGVFKNVLYKVSKWFNYVFNGKLKPLKYFIFFCSLIAILVFLFKIYYGFNNIL